MYRVTFNFHVYPEEWRASITVVVRKLAKPDYSAPGVYCPIALLSTMKEMLSMCAMEDIIQMAKIHGLLPEIGCHPGRTMTD